MRLTLKTRSTAASVSVFLLTLYCFTAGGIKSYIFPSAIVALIAFGCIILCISYSCSIKVNSVRSYTGVLTILCIGVILLNRNANFQNFVFENDLALIVGFIFLLVARNSNIWHKYFLRFCILWGMIHSIITVLEYFIPGLYESMILPIFKDTAYYSDLVWVFSNGKMPGIAGHFSTNGIYLSSVLCLMAITFLTRRKKEISTIIFLVLVACALLLTGKRAVLIFSVSGIFFAYYCYNANRPMKRIFKVVELVIAVFAIFTALGQYIPGVYNFIIRFQETAGRGDVTSGRTDLYLLAIALFSKNPIFGIGWDAYKYYYSSHLGELLNTHNVYLQLLAENGVILSLPFFVLFVALIVRSTRELIRTRKSEAGADRSKETALSISSGFQLFFLLYCLTGNPLYDPQMFFPYICAVAMGEFYVIKSQRDSKTRNEI